MLTYTSLTSDPTRATFNEHNDCAVIATAVVTGMSYQQAHNALAVQGRRNRCGTHPYQYLKAIRLAGFEVEDVTGLFIGRTIRTVERELRHAGGRYLVRMPHHVAGFDGEALQDWTAGRLRQVRSIHRITPTTAPVAPVKPAAPVAPVKPAAPRLSTAAAIRALILAGRTNEQILDELRLPASKRHYPSWYRAELKRKAR